MSIAFRLFLCSLLLSGSIAAHATTTVGYEDVGALLPIDGNPWYNGADGAGGFTSGGVQFNNDNIGCCWNGFAYSQDIDTTSPGFLNQYSAFPGQGAGGSATYAVGFAPGTTARLTLPASQPVVGADITNTTYTALSMLQGDDFARQFGTPPDPTEGLPPGSYPDFLLLTIRGFDDAGGETGVVDFYLADYRDSNDDLDYIIEDWTFVDLGALGSVREISFEISGSDLGEFGLNTPAYFALDNLVVPEPSSGALLAFGLLRLARGRSSR